MLEAPSFQSSQTRTSSGTEREFLTRRNFLKLTGYSAASLAIYAGEIERHEIDVVPRTITIAHLPEAFTGFKIVQISDIHLEEFTEAFFLKAVVNRINALVPDMVVFTGDFVSFGPAPKRYAVRCGYRCAEILAQIQCSTKYGILGNHDALVNAGAVTDALVSHGIPVLVNDSLPIERGGKRIWLAGVEDVLFQSPDLAKALPATAASHEPIILLAHEPDFADQVIGRPVSLILSGHTHGGQVRIPFLKPRLPELGRKYVEGHFSLPGGLQLYVNRGIGTIDLPFRFRCPPELTVLTLEPESIETGISNL